MYRIFAGIIVITSTFSLSMDHTSIQGRISFCRNFHEKISREQNKLLKYLSADFAISELDTLYKLIHKKIRKDLEYEEKETLHIITLAGMLACEKALYLFCFTLLNKIREEIVKTSLQESHLLSRNDLVDNMIILDSMSAKSPYSRKRTYIPAGQKLYTVPQQTIERGLYYSSYYASSWYLKPWIVMKYTVQRCCSKK